MKEDAGGKTILCYLGIFVLLLFIVLPPLFRVIFEEEESDTPTNGALKMNLTCTRTQDFVEYKLKTTISSDYVDDKISYSTFTYEIEIVDNMLTSDSVTIEEYDTLKLISNVDFKEVNNRYILMINYADFDYNNEQLLTNHQKVIAEQLAIYTNESFECNTTKL